MDIQPPGAQSAVWRAFRDGDLIAYGFTLMVFLDRLEALPEPLAPISTQPIRPSRQPDVLSFSVSLPRSADSNRRVPSALVAVICLPVGHRLSSGTHARRGRQCPESAVIMTYMTVCLHSQSPLISLACQSQPDNGRDILSAQRNPPPRMTTIDFDFRRSGGLFPMRSRRIGCPQPPAWKSALVGSGQ